MGTKCQSAKDVCIDIFIQDEVNPYYTAINRDNQQFPTTNDPNVYPNRNNHPSGNNSHFLEAKPNPQYIDSYNAYNNFFHILTRVTKIQRAYRQHQKKLKGKKRLCERAEVPIESKRANDESIATTDKLIKVSCSSFLSLPSNKDEEENIGKIKGYFLLKRSKYYFIGRTQNHKKEGFGIIKWKDGSQLKAYFTSSKVEGVCHYIENLQISFKGYYSHNYPRGYGILNKVKEVSFEGEWEKNNQNGIGIAKWEDGTLYKGQFVNSIKTGIGTLIWPDGTIYQGEFSNNQMTGYGMIIHPDKRIYLGQVLNGKMNGLGQFKWPDGKKYIGNYVKDKKYGLGMFYWNTQPIDAYFGFWENGKQKGPGMQIHGKVIKYGIWNDGLIEIALYTPMDLSIYFTADQSRYKRVFYLKAGQIASLFKELE